MTEAASGYGQPRAFETRDFYLACFLRCAGYKLLDVRAEGRRRVFVFKDRPERRDDVIAFCAEDSSVRALAFAVAIEAMKGLLHKRQALADHSCRQELFVHDLGG